MIFVTVGTHEQPFDRLIEYIDNLRKNGVIQEEVIMQTGYSTYEPEYCVWEKMYTYSQMIEFMNDARIVITHGGPSSFILPLQRGKIPIVVPRLCKYNEHVNDHQFDFALEVEKRNKNIIVVREMNELDDRIEEYDNIVKKMKGGHESNNATFCMELEKIVSEMFKEK